LMVNIIIGFQWSLDFNGDPGENELVGVTLLGGK